MKAIEAVGMLAVGAVLTVGISAFVGREKAPKDVDQAAVEAPVADVATPEDDVQVSRANSDMDTFAVINDLINRQQSTDIDLNEVVEPLTEEQLQVIEFFRATARRQNESYERTDAIGLRLNNMAVADLNVRYYYTVPQKYDLVRPASLLSQQEGRVIETICGSDDIMTLMETYGFDYTYSYVSQDGRLIGTIDASFDTCTG